MAGSSTQERVRDAALELFAERGYHGTGIRQLAARAGVSSASLYHYMGTKEELLVAIMHGSLAGLLDRADEIARTSPDPVARLEALVRMHVTSHARRPLETRVVDGEVGVLSGAARDLVVDLRDRYETVWQRGIEDGVAAGRFQVASTAVARRALLEMCSGVARWYDPTGPLGLTELADQYAAMGRQLLGATTPAGDTPERSGRDTPGKARFR